MKSLRLFFLVMVVAILATTVFAVAPITMQEDLLPRYMTHGAGSPTVRVPFAYRLTLNGLNSAATYRLINMMDSAGGSANGACNAFEVPPTNLTGWTYSSSPDTNTVGKYITFTGVSSLSNWFITEPTANRRLIGPLANQAARAAFVKITMSSQQVWSTSSVKSLGINTTYNSTDTAGSFLYGILPDASMDKNFVFVYDNAEGTGRPIGGSFVESTGLSGLPASYLLKYKDSVRAFSGRFGVVIPNYNANGVKRIEIRSLTDGSIIRTYSTSNAVWPSGANTIFDATTNIPVGTVGLRLAGSDFATVLAASTPAGGCPNTGTVDFGTINLGQNSDIVFTLANHGARNSNLTVVSSNNTEFAVTNNNATSIGGYNNTKTFTIHFAPTNTGARTSTITITSDDVSSPYTISLTGTGDQYTSLPVPNPAVNPQDPWVPTIPTDPTIGTTPTAPVILDFPPQIGPFSNPTTVTVTQTTTVPPALIGSGLVDANHVINRFWTITPDAENFQNATLTFHFTAADLPLGIGDPVTVSPPLYAIFSNDGGITWHPVAGVVTGPDGNGVYSMTVSGLNHFSKWALGSGALLPVTLSTFDVIPVSQGTRLRWTTETEMNVKHFIIERWAQGSENVVQRIQTPSKAPNGSSPTPLSYAVEDNFLAIPGTFYHYRLSEETLDGVVNELRTRVVQFPTAAQVPTGFDLLKAYPNPFNPSTRIRVQLSEPGFATVSVFNINGQLVTELFKGNMTTDAKNFNFDGSNLPSGVYLVQVSSTQLSMQKKIVLMK